MGRMKVGIAAASVVVVLVGVTAAATMRGDGGSNRAVTASQSTEQSPMMAGPVPVAGPPVTQRANTTPSTKGAAATKATQAKTAPLNSIPPTPSAQDIKKIIAAITAPVAAPADSTATTAPLTKEQVEAQLREQLKLLGITY